MFPRIPVFTVWLIESTVEELPFLQCRFDPRSLPNFDPRKASCFWRVPVSTVFFDYFETDVAILGHP